MNSPQPLMKFISLTVPVIYLFVGYAVVNFMGAVVKMESYLEPLLWLVALVILNVFIAIRHRLNLEFLIRFSPAKFHYLLIGVGIGLIPIVGVLIFWKMSGVYWTFYWDYNVIYFFPFILKVFLMELWFRAMPLQLAEREWGVYPASLVFAVLASAMLHQSIFLTGDSIILSYLIVNFLLCLVFLTYQSFWLTLGMQAAFILVPEVIYFEGSRYGIVQQPTFTLLATFLAAIAAIHAWRRFHL